MYITSRCILEKLRKALENIWESSINNNSGDKDGIIKICWINPIDPKNMLISIQEELEKEGKKKIWNQMENRYQNENF